MILLTCAKIPDGLDKNTLASAVRLMFPHRDNEKYIEDIRGRKNGSSACESLFALAMLYERICELPCRVVTEELIFDRNENGKPFFKGSDLKFNISHSRGFVACAASIGEEVGIDVEAAIIPAEKAEKLASRYFSKEELAAILSDHNIFTRLWCEKEAEAKFYGKSVVNILSDLKNKVDQNVERCICLHRFEFDSIPIILCTKRDFSTIIFSV